MKQRSSVCLMKWLALMLASLLPLSGIAAEPVKGVQIPSAIDLTLPIHQKQKLHPELSDPVLGDQAQIVEWAWSPQYAKRFNQLVQPDGLKDGALWLIGIKVQRKQNKEFQSYQCSIIGLMDNKLAMITPPGEMYIVPGYGWQGGMPGLNMAIVLKEFTPAQTTWYKQPKNELEQTRPERSITVNYLVFYRQLQNGLAYFEINGGCGYFNDPQLFRNEIRFPTKFIHENRTAVFEPDAIHFDVPDGLMRRIYPYIREAEDWTSCFMTRELGKKAGLTTRALKSKRFGNTCEPITQKQK